MGVSPLMAIGVRAMAANYAALQTTGHNIANASVDGYSRQSVELSTSDGLYTGAGFFGRGVDVDTVSRAHDALLASEASNTRSLAAMDSTRLAQLRRLEEAFKTGEGGIGDAVSQLFAAASDLSSHPDDLAARQVVLGRARDLASAFKSAVGSLQGVQAGITAELENSVTEINNLAQSVAELNGRIASMQGLGHAPNDLLDQRDQLISRLAEQVQLGRIDAPDGTVSLFIGGGQALVLGVEATPLRVGADPDTGGRVVELMAGGSLAADGSIVGGEPRRLSADSFGGGTVKALLDVQNQDLAGARQFLDDLAVAVRDAFNTQQAAGFDLDGQPGEPLFDPAATAGTMRVSLAGPRGIAASESQPGAGEPGDNRNVLAMLALQDDTTLAGLQGQTLNEAWIHAATDIGVRVQSALTSSTMSASVAEQAELSRSSQAGVNLDEEAARLIQFQQSYQAAAKVLQVAQTLFDTLLDATGR